MRKTQVALAAMALVASTAVLAEGVTVYGVLDVGLSRTNTGSTTTKAFAGGGTESPSLIGFKGGEDLGNGMKATFQLEAGFNTGNGAFDNGSYSKLGSTSTAGSAVATSVFGRGANVGLEGSFGSVKAGVHMDPAFAAAAGVDPRGMGNGSGTALARWGYTTGYSPALLQGIFNGNSVMYTSPNINGLQVSGSYGLGGTASSRQDGTQSVGLTYTTGGITLAAWDNSVYSDTANQKAVANGGVGAGIALSDSLSAKLYYNKATTYTSGVTSAEKATFGIGGTYALADNVKLTAAYYSTEDSRTSNSGIGMTVLNVNYGLSPRTSAYLTYVNESANAQAGSYALANKTGSLVGVGVLHSF